jgi:hypothetical protein
MKHPLLKVGLLLSAVALVPILGRAQSAVAIPPGAPLNPGYINSFTASGVDPGSQVDGTVMGAVTGAEPRDTVSVWNGCSINLQAVCALHAQLSGPCTVTVNDVSDAPTCLTILNTVYKTSLSSFIPPVVTMDGSTLSDLSYRDKLGLLALSPNPPATVLACEEAAVAKQVLWHLWYIEGKSSGHTASDAQVQAAIDHQLALLPKLPKRDLNLVAPAGTDPATFLKSPDSYRNYQDMLTIGNMQAAITGSLRGKAADDAIRAWVRSALTRHSLTVTGLPNFSVVDALPDGL